MCDRCSDMYAEYSDYRFCPYCGETIRLITNTDITKWYRELIMETYRKRAAEKRPKTIAEESFDVMIFDPDSVDISNEMEMLKKERLKPLVDGLVKLYIKTHSEEKDEH